MTGRADYIRGLRTLAQLLEDNTDLSLPYHGYGGIEQSVFINGPSPITQALLYIQAMNTPPTMKVSTSIGQYSGAVTWLEIKGCIEGLEVELYLRAEEACEKRPAVYQGSDGVQRETFEWVIPAELVQAAKQVAA